MRKLVLKMSMSIDGFVAGPKGELDWLFKSMSPGSTSWIHDTLVGAGLHIMGSHTYYDMKAYWPYSSDLLAAPMNDIPKVIFSAKGLVADGKTTTAISDAAIADASKGVTLSDKTTVLDSWLNAAVASGDLAEEIKKLKEQPGGYILAHGGAGFARNLISTRLIDEYRLVVHPVLLGAGLPIFSKLQDRIDMQLVSSTALDLGVVASIYKQL
jgi:dihydrofolate reductase